MRQALQRFPGNSSGRAASPLSSHGRYDSSAGTWTLLVGCFLAESWTKLSVRLALRAVGRSAVLSSGGTAVGKIRKSPNAERAHARTQTHTHTCTHMHAQPPPKNEPTRSSQVMGGSFQINSSFGRRLPPPCPSRTCACVYHSNTQRHPHTHKHTRTHTHTLRHLVPSSKEGQQQQQKKLGHPVCTGH